VSGNECIGLKTAAFLTNNNWTEEYQLNCVWSGKICRGLWNSDSLRVGLRQTDIGYEQFKLLL